MSSSRRYRAVSLDLWYTTIWHAPGEQHRWQEARTRLAGRMLIGPDGAPVGRTAAEAALRATERELAASGRSSTTIDPLEILRLAGRQIGARVGGDPDDAGRRFSAAGLDEAPPTINPEAVALARALDAISIPLIAITNTGRRGATWLDAFATLGGPSFRHVIASCDLGTAKPDPSIFAEAARRLGVAPAEIVHVGDRWDLDVEGARRAGLGTVLYGGLWDRYALEEYATPDGPFGPAGRAGLPEDVVYVDRLEEIIDRFAWATDAGVGRRTP